MSIQKKLFLYFDFENDKSEKTETGDNDVIIDKETSLLKLKRLSCEISSYLPTLILQRDL